MFNTTQQEKRSYFRMQMNCPMYVSSEDGSFRMQGTCINLSIKGILMELDSSVPTGSSLIIKIEPELDISPALSGLLEVLRVEYQPETGKYHVAGELETEVVV